MNKTERFLQWTLRVASVVLILNFAVSLLSYSYFRAYMSVVRGWDGLDFKVMAISTILLPIIVVWEVILYSQSKISGNPLMIDALFVIVWFALFWGSAIYGFFNYAMI